MAGSIAGGKTRMRPGSIPARARSPEAARLWQITQVAEARFLPPLAARSA
jgi:hypothetical protein